MNGRDGPCKNIQYVCVDAADHDAGSYNHTRFLAAPQRLCCPKRVYPNRFPILSPVSTPVSFYCFCYPPLEPEKRLLKATFGAETVKP